jgi:hypothetical protein
MNEYVNVARRDVARAPSPAKALKRAGLGGAPIFVARSQKKQSGRAQVPLAPIRAIKFRGFSRRGRCTTMVYTGVMPTSKQVRRSLTLPAPVAQQVNRIAKRRRLSENRVLVELIEEGIESQQQKEKAFFQLAEKFRAASDPEEIKRLGDELGRFVFGDVL